MQGRERWRHESVLSVALEPAPLGSKLMLPKQHPNTWGQLWPGREGVGGQLGRASLWHSKVDPCSLYLYFSNTNFYLYCLLINMQARV